ncbi:MAG TPA: sulfatase [Nocardioidaceae bacterium]
MSFMSVRRSGRALAAWLAAGAVAVITASTTVVVTEQPVVAADKRPNIILITTDDMSLTDLRWMPQTRKLIRGAGANVSGFLSNHPLCCAARAEILTGQYAHNNGVHHNGGQNGGYPALLSKSQHIGTWLRNAGYRTAFVGKHLNLWEQTRHRQPGWSRFNPALRGIYHPFRITMFHGGQPRTYRGTHTSDLMGQFTTRYIRAFSRSGAPFFIWTSQVAPHQMNVDGRWRPPVPAVRHRDLYATVMPPTLSDPAYDGADVSDKPPYVQASTTVSRDTVIAWHRARIRSLRSVDDQVKEMVEALRSVGELRNTFIFFTSDNGYMLGEHRQTGKNKPYEESVRVPLVVRGPGIPAGALRREIYGLVDLAPTFLHIAGATAGRPLDGRSMLPTLRRGTPGYDNYLMQAGHADAPWWWRGVGSTDFVYTRYDADGFEELYDMRSDPHQLQNVANDPDYAATKAEYAARLAALSTCAGPTCLEADIPPEPPTS